MNEKKNISFHYISWECWNDIFIFVSLGSKHEWWKSFFFSFFLHCPKSQIRLSSVACGLKYIENDLYNMINLTGEKKN